jgi:hypothetical protein
MNSDTVIAGVIAVTLAVGGAGLYQVANADATKPVTAIGQKTPDTKPLELAQTPPSAPPATRPADAAKSTSEASKPEAWNGLPVIASDGKTLGQVSELKPSADGKSSVLMVKGSDGKVYKVPSSISTMQGRAVQVAATAAEIGKFVE